MLHCTPSRERKRVVTLYVILSAIVNALVLGFISRRLLGVPVGWPRTIVVSLVIAQGTSGALRHLPEAVGLNDQGLFAGGPGSPSGAAVLVLTLATAWAFALGLGLLVILEAIVPTGTLPNPATWVRTLGARRRRSRRYTQIVGIAVRHGLGGFLRGRSRLSPTQSTSTIARSLRLALTDGGVTFVKLGQMLATRPDLIGPAFARELGTLQSEVAPEPWPVVEATIAGQLGRPVDEVFASIDEEPLAAASVAQVHAAALLDGTPVVIKAQRQSARRQVAADLDIVLRLARWLERTTGWGQALGIRGLAEGFAASLEEELDYTVELANTNAIAAGLHRGAEGKIRVPRMYAEWCGPRLLVMERLAGQPVSQAGALLARLPAERRQAMAEDLLGVVLRQVLVDGVFHADLHQGNIYVSGQGAMAMLDLGSVGRLDAGARRGLGMVLHAVDRNDSLAAADALLGVLGSPGHLDDRAFEREVGEVIQRYRTGFGGAGSGGMFTALFAIIVRHGFAVPPQVAAALRALGSLEGTLATISPGFDLVSSARAQGRTLMGEQFSPSRVRATLEDQLLNVLPMVQRLPRRLNAITDKLDQGRLSVNVRLLADPRDRGFIDGIVRQLTITVLAAASAICGVLLVTSDTGPMMLPQLRLFTFIGATLFFFAFVLAARALALVFRHGPAGGERLRA